MQIGIALQWRITDLITPSQSNLRPPSKATLPRTVAKKGPTCPEIMGLPSVKKLQKKKPENIRPMELKLYRKNQ